MNLHYCKITQFFRSDKLRRLSHRRHTQDRPQPIHWISDANCTHKWLKVSQKFYYWGFDYFRTLPQTDLSCLSGRSLARMSQIILVQTLCQYLTGYIILADLHLQNSVFAMVYIGIWLSGAKEVLLWEANVLLHTWEVVDVASVHEQVSIFWITQWWQVTRKRHAGTHIPPQGAWDGGTGNVRHLSWLSSGS